MPRKAKDFLHKGYRPKLKGDPDKIKQAVEMTLLREIQVAATDGQVGVSTVLRKAKILAARLHNQDFEDWVNRELNGYDDSTNLPPYRVIPITAKEADTALAAFARLAFPVARFFQRRSPQQYQPPPRQPRRRANLHTQAG